MENLKIEYIPIVQVKPYEKNARKHKNFDVDAIVDRCERFTGQKAVKLNG